MRDRDILRAWERALELEILRLRESWIRTEQASRLRPADAILAHRSARARAAYLDARTAVTAPRLRAS